MDSKNKKWVSQLKYEGVTDKDFSDANSLLKKRFGKEPNIRDVLWYIMNQRAVKEALKGNSGMYYSMSRFVYEEGRNPADFLRVHAEIELNGLKKSGVVKTIKICTCSGQDPSRIEYDSCNACKKLEGMVLDIDEAIRQKILPCKECSYRMDPSNKFPFCRCFYRPNDISMG